MKKGARGIVKNYVKLHKDEFKYILQTEKRFEFVISEAIVAGQIDLLKKVDENGKLTELKSLIQNRNDKMMTNI